MDASIQDALKSVDQYPVDYMTYEDMPPLPNQYQLSAGDWAISLEAGNWFGKVMDDEDVREMWEDDDISQRYLKSLVPVVYRLDGGENQKEYYGWFYRSSCLPLTEEEAANIAFRYLFPIPMAEPDWLLEKVAAHALQMQENEITIVAPRPCAACGSYKNLVRMSIVIGVEGISGSVKVDGEEKVTNLNVRDAGVKHASADLHCKSCGHTEELGELGENWVANDLGPILHM